MPRASARAFEALVKAQRKSDRAFTAHVALEADVGESGILEHVHGYRQSRWSHGTGGGKRSERHNGAD